MLQKNGIRLKEVPHHLVSFAVTWTCNTRSLDAGCGHDYLCICIFCAGQFPCSGTVKILKKFVVNLHAYCIRGVEIKFPYIPADVSE